jgi:hypothetical protein
MIDAAQLIRSEVYRRSRALATRPRCLQRALTAPAKTIYTKQRSASAPTLLATIGSWNDTLDADVLSI